MAETDWIFKDCQVGSEIQEIGDESSPTYKRRNIWHYNRYKDVALEGAYTVSASNIGTTDSGSGITAFQGGFEVKPPSIAGASSKWECVNEGPESGIEGSNFIRNHQKWEKRDAWEDYVLPT